MRRSLVSGGDRVTCNGYQQQLQQPSRVREYTVRRRIGRFDARRPRQQAQIKTDSAPDARRKTRNGAYTRQLELSSVYHCPTITYCFASNFPETCEKFGRLFLCGCYDFHFSVLSDIRFGLLAMLAKYAIVLGNSDL